MKKPVDKLKWNAMKRWQRNVMMEQNRRGKLKTYYTIVNLNSNISTITLYTNDIKLPIKRQIILSYWGKKARPSYVF